MVEEDKGKTVSLIRMFADKDAWMRWNKIGAPNCKVHHVYQLLIPLCLFIVLIINGYTIDIFEA